jgi:hypothetical protein
MTRFMQWAMPVILLVLCTVVPASADGMYGYDVTSALYQMNGVITETGIAGNTASQTTDVTFDFYFVLNFNPPNPDYVAEGFATPVIYTSTGDLGNYSGVADGWVGDGGFGQDTEMQFAGQSLDIDWVYGLDLNPQTWFGPNEYSCTPGSVCNHVFDAGNNIGDINAQMTYTLSLIPEPGTLSLLGFGMLGLGLVKAKRL